MGSIVAENRKSLMLFSGRGFPELVNEIGEVLDRSPGAVRVLLHRALRDLAARLDA